jgi:hypothetical protein
MQRLGVEYVTTKRRLCPDRMLYGEDWMSDCAVPRPRSRCTSPANRQ